MSEFNFSPPMSEQDVLFATEPKAFLDFVEASLDLTEESIFETLKEEFDGLVKGRFKPREEQLIVFQVVAKWIHTYFTQGIQACKHLVVDAPTGVGKSLIAMTTTLTLRRISDELDLDLNQVFLITERKILQDQYAVDFPNSLFNLKGLDNYPCYMDAGKSCGESKCGRVANKPGGTKTFPEVCTKNCGYDVAVKQSLTEPVILTNSAKYLNLVKFHIGNKYEDPALVIYDEGHNVENLLDSEASLDLSTKVFERLKLDMNEYFRGVMQTSPPEYLMECMDKFLIRLGLILASEEVAEPNARDVKRMRLLENLITKIKEVKAAPEEFVFVHEPDQNEKITMQFKPRYVHKAFRQFFKFPTIFCSATMLSKQGFQTMTGLRDEEIEWVSVNTPFKKENRPINNYWYLGAKALNYNNMSTEFPNVVTRIQTILDKHPEERGIIHAQSYSNADKIYEGLRRKYGSRLIYPKNAKEQKEALDTLSRISNGVLISPSMTEGVDLKDDLCYDAETEILTDIGWVRFPDLQEGTKVAAFNAEDNSVQFEEPSRLVKLKAKKWVEFDTATNNLFVTSDHRMLWQNDRTKKYVETTAWEAPENKHFKFVCAGQYEHSEYPISDDEIRLAVALQADGHWEEPKSLQVKFGFRKPRKVERLKGILANLSIPFKVQKNSRGDEVFYLSKKDLQVTTLFGAWEESKRWDLSFLFKLSLRQRKIFLNELTRWDGEDITTKTRERHLYGSTIPYNLDVVNAIASISGYRSSTSGYQVTWYEEPSAVFVPTEHNYIKKEYDLEMDAYCVTVTTGWVVVRRRGKVTVSGNCRFVVLAKVPYLRTVDPVVALRMRTISNWYEYRSCMTIVQAVGRGVRNESDYAITYLVDPGFAQFFGRAKHLLPEWFKESWDQRASGPL